MIFNASRVGLGRVLTVVSMVIIALATLTPSGETHLPGSLCLICGEVGGTDAVLNVLLFVPLGVGLALLGVGRLRAVALMAFCSAGIELLQLTLIPGRDGAVGDFLTNSVGAALGFAVGANLDSLVFPGSVLAAWLTGGWLCVWILVQAISSYAFQPRPTDARYFGQLIRPLGDEITFPGRVLRATLAGDPVPDWDLRDSHRAYDALAGPKGAVLEVLLESSHVTSGLAPLVRILDDRHQEEFMLAADRRRLLFSERTGAANLRLRPASFRLDDVFTPGAGVRTSRADTVHLRALYALPRVTLESRSGSRFRGRAIRVTPAAGWRLVAPFYSYADGSPLSNAGDAAWLFMLLFPAGYWFTWIERERKRQRPGVRVDVFVGSGAALATGFLIGPQLFSMATPTWWELAGALGGIFAGVIVAIAAFRTCVHPNSFEA